MSSSLRGLDRGAAIDLRGIKRVDPLAEKPDRPDVVRLRAERQDIAADIGIGVLDGVFNLLHRHAVLLHQPGVDEDLILLDGPAITGDVDHAGNLLEGAIEDPVLHGLELPRRVARALQHVTHDLADRTPRRQPRRHARRANCRSPRGD